MSDADRLARKKAARRRRAERIPPPPLREARSVGEDWCPACGWEGYWDGAVCPECGEHTMPISTKPKPKPSAEAIACPGCGSFEAVHSCPADPPPPQPVVPKRNRVSDAPSMPDELSAPPAEVSEPKDTGPAVCGGCGGTTTGPDDLDCANHKRLDAPEHGPERCGRSRKPHPVKRGGTSTPKRSRLDPPADLPW